MRLTLIRLAFAVMAFPLTVGAAHAFDDFEYGGVSLPTVKTTVIAPTNVAAGIGNTAVQDTSNIGNFKPGLGLKIGRDGSVDTTVVVPTNVSAGIGNTAVQDTSNIANFQRKRH